MSTNPKPQDDSRTEPETPSYSGTAKFLWETPQDTPLDEIAERYERWADDSEQSNLEAWSE